MLSEKSNNNCSNSIIWIICNNNSMSRNRGNSMASQSSLWFHLFLICCSCHILGLLQLAAALPFEYFDEHDDLNYDLDTVQSQAKYDAHLLSEQMLSDAELEQKPDTGIGTTGSNKEQQQQEEDNMEPHSRAAACFTNGRKYTHGQKVRRWDPCEVCLCMDGEIFCWWEKYKANVSTEANEYSDPYRYETTTKSFTKLYKAPRRVGKRHKHHKNQKNFNDYQVYHSHKQADYKKEHIKQLKQKSNANNYNKIKEHKHTELQQQHQNLQPVTVTEAVAATTEEVEVSAAATATAARVNQAAKEMHYQQQQQQEQEQQQHLQQLHEQQLERTHQHHQQQHAHTHPSHSSHASSKILNFPENLPSLLYYDYKTEEHEHHQHQHHQQHLLHQQQRLQQQQQQQQQQQEALVLHRQPQGPGSIVTSADPPTASRQRALEAGVELSSSSRNSFDDAETDSDILPEPPTKRPKATRTTTKTATTTTTMSMAKALMTSSASSSLSSSLSVLTTESPAAPIPETMAAKVTVKETGKQASADKSNEMPQEPMATGPDTDKPGDINTAMHKNQHNIEEHDREMEELDDAFHRWLTSTELNVDSENTNTLDDNLTASEQETSASTIIDDVGSNQGGSKSNNITEANVTAHADTPADGQDTGHKDTGYGNSIGIGNGNTNTNNIADNADAVFFRSSYNDYSSEFNGSVVNIDITLTAVDVHPQHLHQQPKQAPESTQMLAKVVQADLIANDNKTATATEPPTLHANQEQQQQQPPYMLTSIITTDTTTSPVPTERMCNVLGKLYKIGDILPQDTGNCLQCICTDAVTPDEQPSVTCSPHNCPPLVLPDLFDATGY
ncbi:probable serine/threonine-protein kinase tsuA isoform X2 [Scaptodrosophila lebanonensis]|uniref:Probable serine/threonine-protein kinase tsuA isoform X2 n=1 Tax=Drosophila lebanonensis TaxID=7225 RepID=A0A6J2UBA3_DROLE|nr:probable serine/threonine-protein kinase tsuA isoform X2 [Scaptodrosophila lebanonensis]